ncbi:hypothetical protein BT96DRAFT_1094532 [Gymnopus androsaceus JB14]|uniref:HNH nuclease domain-containing protein n=1 Tax=Gymnopus androsaceus JB14 TaxID=1447944 RepID=A0A6A4HUJ9_9AGAR|nr:hypothetical protein BT96DRAFT_1094532 [Gymnopus androsaceus JB14]
MSTTSRLPPFATLRSIEQPKDSIGVVTICHSSTNECFLHLYTRCYPVQGGGRSETAMIPKALVLDACRILTGIYQEEVRLYDDHDDCVVEGEMLRSGNYLFQVESSEKQSDYGIYKSFHTWRPPTRNQVPSYWFTASSPQMFDGGKNQPTWALLPPTNRDEMRSYMSEKAKSSDGFVCSLTGVQSSTVEGGLAVPADEKVFYTEREITAQLYPSGYAIPQSLATDQLVHDIRNYITLSTHIRNLWDRHILVFYPLAQGRYSAYFLGHRDGYSNSLHLMELSLAHRTDPYLLFIRFAFSIFKYYKVNSYCGSPPPDALPDLFASSTQRKWTESESSEGTRETRTSSDDNCSEQNSEDGKSTVEEEEDGPIGFKQLFEDAEAQGMQLSEDMEDLVGSYHPDRKRIAQTAAEYLARNPAVGIHPDDVLSYNVFRIS